MIYLGRIGYAVLSDRISALLLIGRASFIAATPLLMAACLSPFFFLCLFPLTQSDLLALFIAPRKTVTSYLAFARQKTRDGDELRS